MSADKREMRPRPERTRSRHVCVCACVCDRPLPSSAALCNCVLIRKPLSVILLSQWNKTHITLNLSGDSSSYTSQNRHLIFTYFMCKTHCHYYKVFALDILMDISGFVCLFYRLPDENCKSDLAYKTSNINVVFRLE